MFTQSEETTPNCERRDEVRQVLATMPAEMAGAFNLMTSPFAGAAAMSALGVSMASQAFGLWMSSLSSAVALSHQMMAPVLDEMPLAADDFRDQSRTSEMRAEEAVEALIADVERSQAPEPQAAEPEAVGPETAEEAKGEAVAPTAKPGKAKSAAARSAVVDAPASRRPAAIERPAVPDDLKAIAGVGPKLEQVLNGFGLWTYAQIAALSAEEAAWVEEALGLQGRIARDGWAAQAVTLAGARA
jgi:NADH-quinone oxidoreductase subunit E